MRKNFRLVIAGATLAAGLLFAGVSSVDVLAASTTVTADACNVRSEASTSSDSVFSVKRGQKLEVLDSTTSDDGYTWYKVDDGGKTGYIRADLVETPDGTVNGDGNNNNDDANADNGEPQSIPATVSNTDALTAVVTADTVTVRSGASKNTDKAGSAKNGQEVSISGESTDSEGYKWYQVSFVDGNSTVSGYMRSDFLQVTATREEEPVAPEEPVYEEPEEVVVVPEQPQDYECRYEANADGIDEWFLYDHINGTKQSINNIYAVMKQSQEMSQADSDSSGALKIVVIIMGVVIVALIVAVVILIIRSRDHYESFHDIDRDDDDYDYEDEEEFAGSSDDYEEEEDDYEEEEDEPEETYSRPRKLGLGGKRKERRAKRGAFDFDDEDEEDDDDENNEYYQRPVRRTSRSYDTEQEAWSTAGMLDIDDDMEFEFLDLDK